MRRATVGVIVVVAVAGVLLMWGASTMVGRDADEPPSVDAPGTEPLPAESARTQSHDDAPGAGRARPRVEVDAPTSTAISPNAGATKAGNASAAETSSQPTTEPSAGTSTQSPNPFGERNPEKLRKIAEEMHVGETVIVSALHAEKLLRQTHTQRVDTSVGEAAEAALADLAGYGVEGYRAVLAMIRTGYQGTWFVRLVKTTYQPGYEDELIAVAGDETVAEFSRWSALESLQIADTPAVREFLRAYMAEHDDDAGLFMSAALALGGLRDADSAHLVRGKLFRERWSGVQGYLITALGGMGGEDAREILVAFIRDDRAERVAGAFRALARVDIEAARDEAERFFDTERGKSVSSYDRRLIEDAIAPR